MRKLLILILILPLLIGCMGDQEKIKKLEAINDSLRRQSQAKDQIVEDFSASFNEIEDNLAIIKEKEKIIRVDAGNEEISDNAKERINDDIFDIYKIMLENKKKLKKLEQRLSASGVKSKQFKRMITKLTNQIEEKNGQIETLKTDLGKANFNIENLNERLSSLSTNLDSLESADREKTEIISEQTTELNTAYYVFGTKKELKKHGVITKEGGFIGIGRMAKLKSNFNKDYFTKIDITKINEISIGSRKAKVITSHPESSYVMSGDKKVDKLIIKDAKEFWSISKYLVIIVD